MPANMRERPKVTGEDAKKVVALIVANGQNHRKFVENLIKSDYYTKSIKDNTTKL